MKALDISSATALVAADLLKALAILSDTTVRRPAIDREDPKTLNIRPQIFVKLSFRELCGSKLSGLHPFDNMAIIHCVKNRL